MLVWFTLEHQVIFKSAFLKLNWLFHSTGEFSCNIRKPEVVFKCFLSKQGTNFSQEDDTFIYPYLPNFVSFVHFYWTTVLRNKYQALLRQLKTYYFLKLDKDFLQSSDLLQNPPHSLPCTQEYFFVIMTKIRDIAQA